MDIIDKNTYKPTNYSDLDIDISDCYSQVFSDTPQANIVIQDLLRVSGFKHPLTPDESVNAHFYKLGMQFILNHIKDQINREVVDEDQMQHQV